MLFFSMYIIDINLYYKFQIGFNQEFNIMYNLNIWATNEGKYPNNACGAKY